MCSLWYVLLTCYNVTWHRLSKHMSSKAGCGDPRPKSGLALLLRKCLTAELWLLGSAEQEVSQAGKPEEAGPFSVLQCRCVAATDFEKHWGYLFICADGALRTGHRPPCLATQECPVGLASPLASTSGASPGLSWPCSVFSTSGFSLADFTQSSIPGAPFPLSLFSL